MTKDDVRRAISLVHNSRQIDLEGLRFVSGSRVPGYQFFSIFVNGQKPRLLAVVEFRGHAHISMERYSSVATWYRNLLFEALEDLFFYDITELQDECSVMDVQNALHNAVPA
jgi:hypothetical protein